MNKKRIKNGGDQLAAWKVSSNQDNNYKTNVPINATLISTIAAGVSLFAIIWMGIFLENEILTKLTYGVVIIVSAFQMPLVVAFTVKHHKKTSTVNHVVPCTLQFHEEEENLQVI